MELRYVHHWWPDCPLWPADEAEDLDPNRVHFVAATRDEVNCPHCLKDPDVRPPRD